MELAAERRASQRYSKSLKSVKFSTVTNDDIRTLALIYRKVTKIQRFSYRTFKAIVHNSLDMTEKTLMERVFKTFKTDRSKILHPAEFVSGLAVILFGTLDQKIKYCYKVYDESKDDYIPQKQAQNYLRECFVTPSFQENEEKARGLTERVFKLMGNGLNDGITLKDYQKLVRREPLFMEAFGPCLPPREAVDAFKTIFSSRYNVPKRKVSRVRRKYKNQ